MESSLPPSVNDSKTSSHIHILDHLRGAAALAVCLFHFACGNRDYLPSADIVRSVSGYGWLGVEVFFVISGFVIPYSLVNRPYSLQNVQSFFIKRFKRIEPPYLACIFLTLLLSFCSTLAPGYRGPGFEVSLPQVFAHFGYLNAFLGFPWLNPAFWTLAIEFQYYLFIALVFPLLNHRQLAVRVASVLFIALLGIADRQNSALLLHWLPLFALGMASFQFCCGHLRNWQYVLLLFVIAPICYQAVGASETIAGVLTALTIVFCGKRRISPLFDPLAGLGTISYSLYLIHIPIGGRIINLTERLSSSVIHRYFGIIVALAISIGCAYLFWLLIEKPSQRWSKSGTLSPRPSVNGQESSNLASSH